MFMVFFCFVLFLLLFSTGLDSEGLICVLVRFLFLAKHILEFQVIYILANLKDKLKEKKNYEI